VAVKIGDSVWIVIRNHPDKIHVTPHVEREGAYAEVNAEIDRMFCARVDRFKDPGPNDPEARLDAWNEYQAKMSDPYLIHVEKETLVP
jgi:hypothetical protein